MMSNVLLLCALSISYEYMTEKAGAIVAVISPNMPSAYDQNVKIIIALCIHKSIDCCDGMLHLPSFRHC